MKRWSRKTRDTDIIDGKAVAQTVFSITFETDELELRNEVEAVIREIMERGEVDGLSVGNANS